VDLWWAFLAGFVLAATAAPVGVSGAVFLLPVHVALGVPSPAVTPTNLLFNLVAVPGSLLRYGRRLADPLVGTLLRGTLPGVVAGAAVRVYVVPGDTEFRLIAGALLLAVAAWLLVPRGRAGARGFRLSDRGVTAVAVVAGLVGGVYGVGGGSILAPVLVAAGLAASRVAPAALLATFCTSLLGIVAYALLATGGPGAAGPVWHLGLAAGAGGLLGGNLGARLQPRLPEPVLRAMFGAAAAALGVLYVAEAVS
jgi:uncharacterized protein